MKFVYIPTEIKIRDFRSRLLIALRCVDRGMVAIFGVNSSIRKIILNSPPGIYLDKSVSINKLKFLKLINRSLYLFQENLKKYQTHKLIFCFLIFLE